MSEWVVDSEERRRNRRRIRRWLGVGLVVAGAVVAAVWLVSLDRRLVRGFEAHLRSQPGVIYAAQLSFVRGQPLPSELPSRLKRLGYRTVEEAPAGAGEYRWLSSDRANDPDGGSGVLQLGLRPEDDLLPGPEAPDGPITLTIDAGRLSQIAAAGQPRAPVALLLGAEPLGLITGPHRLSMELVPLSEVPRELLAAILTTEDRRFWQHHGVDPRAIGRAFLANLRAGQPVQGGSTLTQQLVKNLFLGHEKTYQRKLTEAAMALLLEARYSKETILEAYLNSIYFGVRKGAGGSGAQAVIGIGEASRYYFGRPVGQLSIAEQALMAAMIKSPVRYEPGAFQTSGHATERRNLVLRQLEAAGVISAQISESAQASPVTTLREPEVMTGSAHYVADWVQQQLYDEASAKGQLNLAPPGARILTTIDPRLQRLAETVVSRELAKIQRRVETSPGAPDGLPLQAALVAIDPKTGAVKALVGGRDYRESQFNRAVAAMRQPGSLFKPVVYLVALEKPADGPPLYTLASVVPDEPITLQAGGREWTPQNVDLTYHGPVRFRQVAELSLNVATVQIAAAVGIDRVASLARRIGASGDRELPLLPSVALGAIEATPLEMATLYATLANGGRRVDARVIDLLVDPTAADAAVWPRREPEAVVDPETAFLVTSLLSGVIDRGTGRRVRTLGFERPAAGKTGTSSDLHDAWFAGYTPDLVALVWVGYDQPRSIGLTGSQAALPIWTAFMREALGDEPIREFERPEGVVQRQIDPATGKLTTWRCPPGEDEWFIEGTEPTESCAGRAAGEVVQGWLSRAWQWVRGN